MKDGLKVCWVIQEVLEISSTSRTRKSASIRNVQDDVNVPQMRQLGKFCHERGRHCGCGCGLSPLSFLMASIVVLPGEHVPAQHVNLKLGPGLLQLSTHRVSPNGQPIISTRAGQLHHSANNSRWWVEGNARRVCFLRAVSVCTYDHFQLVCPSTPRERDRCRPRSQRRGVASRRWLCTSCST